MQSLYDISVSLNLRTAGFGAAVGLALKAFGDIQREATRTQGAVENALTSRTSSYTSLERATNSTQMAQLRYNQAVQDHLRISGQQGAASDAAARSLNRLQQSHLSLANAQLTQTSAANKATNAQAQYDAASRSALASQASQDRMGTGMNLLAAGGVITGGGLLGLGILKDIAQKAMALNTVQTDIAMGLTDNGGRGLSASARAAALAGLSNQEITIGLRNQMSQMDVAQIVDSAVHSGMTKAGSLGAILPSLANFAEVLKMTRGYTPTQSASTASQFAHLFGAWSPTAFSSMTNLLGRSLFVSPASPQEFLTLTSQFAGQVRPLYGNTAADRAKFTQDAITSSLLMAELGQESRGGTQLAQFVTRTLGGVGARGSAQNKALAQIHTLSGVNFYDAGTGKFTGIPALLGAIGLARNAPGENPEKFGLLMKEAFGQVGGRIAGLFADPISQARLGTLKTMLGPNGLPTMGTIKQAFNQSDAGRLSQFNANWETFTTLLGTQLLPALAPALQTLTGFTRGLVDFARHNPEIVKIAANLLLWGTALALIVGPIVALSGAILLISGAAGVIGVTAAGIVAFATGLGEVALVIGGIVGGLLLLRVAMMGIADWLDRLLGIHPKHTGPTPSNTTFIPGTGTTHYTDPNYRFGDIQRGGQWGQFVGGRWRDDGPVAARGSNVPNPPGHTMPGVGGGGRSVPIVINVNGADHATTEDLAKRLMAHIGAALGHDTYYGSIGLGGSLEPGMGGY